MPVCYHCVHCMEWPSPQWRALVVSAHVCILCRLCMHACTHTHTHLHMHTHTHTPPFTCTHRDPPPPPHTHTFICTHRDPPHTHTCTHTSTHAPPTHPPTHTHTHRHRQTLLIGYELFWYVLYNSVSMCVCVCVCRNACVSEFMCEWIHVCVLHVDCSK